MALDFSKLQAESERMLNGGKNNTNFLDNFIQMPAKAGIIRVRLVTPVGWEIPFIVNGIHKINGRNIHCLKTPGDRGGLVGDCPICSFNKWLWSQADALKEEGKDEESEEKKNEARAIKRNERFYYIALVRGKESEGLKILSVGQKMQKKILTALVGDKAMDEPALGDITDPRKGRDLKIIKEEQGDGFPNYDRSRFEDPSELCSPDQIDAIMATAPDLNTLRRPKSIEDLEQEIRIYMGVAADNRGTGFDPTKFQGSSSANVSVPHVVSHVDDKPSSPSVASSHEIGINEDDFMRELNDM